MVLLIGLCLTHCIAIDYLCARVPPDLGPHCKSESNIYHDEPFIR